MMRNGQLFEQAIMSEPVTTETDGGCLQQIENLPTPTTMDHLPQRSPEALKNKWKGHAREGQN